VHVGLRLRPWCLEAEFRVYSSLQTANRLSWPYKPCLASNVVPGGRRGSVPRAVVPGGRRGSRDGCVSPLRFPFSFRPSRLKGQ